MNARELVASCIVGIASSLVATELEENWLVVGAVAVGAFLLSVSAIIVWERYPKLFGRGDAIVASVLVFRNEELLLVYNRRQRKWIPPGTHIRRGEQPHIAALRAAEEDSGYKVAFHGWHRPEQEIDRLVTQVPEPYYTQIERQGAGEGHVTHYDLIYVGVPVNAGPQGGLNNHKWVQLGQLDAAETYPDVVAVARKAYNEVCAPSVGNRGSSP